MGAAPSSSVCRSPCCLCCVRDREPEQVSVPDQDSRTAGSEVCPVSPGNRVEVEAVQCNIKVIVTAPVEDVDTAIEFENRNPEKCETCAGSADSEVDSGLGCSINSWETEEDEQMLPSTHVQEVVDMVAGQSDPLSALEQRQESILSRLSNIKQMLDKLTDKYQPASVPKSHTTPGSASSSAPSSSSSMVPGLELMSATSSIPVAASSSLAGKPLQDIVISADPASPPLSLFALYEILRSQLPTLATTYVHSSVSDVKPSLRSVLNNGSQVNRGNHAIALSIIWKKVETGPFLMVSPSNQCQIQGEVNIARYLNRIINPTFDTDDITMATQVDDWLDTAGQQLLNGNSKERAAAMRSLNSRLGRNDWLVGSAFSLADIVSWSAVMQSQQAEGASANVKKWLKACAANPILQSAASVL